VVGGDLTATAPDPSGFETEREYVDACALDTTVRQLSLGALAITPAVIVVAVAFGGRLDRAHLLAWVAMAVVAQALAAWGWVRHRRAVEAADRSGLRLHVHAVALAVAAVWGATALLPDPTDTPLLVTFVLVPFGASAFNVLQCAAVRSLFLTYQLTVLAVAELALIMGNTRESIAVAVAGLVWLVLTVSFHNLVHDGVIASLRLRWHTDELVRSLQSERALLAEANSLLAHQAVHDSLTGLRNRRGTMEVLEQELERARREGSRVAVLYIDLDRFKNVNDSLGHRAGDHLLEVIADRVQRVLPREATAGRLGGDELVAIVPGGDDPHALLELAARVGRAVSEPLHLEGREVNVSASIGIAVGPEDGDHPAELLRHANAALHRAKDRGRDRAEMFDGLLRSEMERRIADERSLRRAIDSADIVPFFQPELDAITGRVVGAEVLARWIRRDGSVAHGAELLTMAQDANTLERLTDAVLHQARPVIRRLAALGLPAGFRFRINLPQRTTPRAWRDDRMEALLAGLDPSMLTLDVSESAVFSDLSHAASRLAALRTRGVRVCLEDAGRGVGSLSLLRSLPLDEIRIDRAAIDALESHPHDRALVRAVIGLSHELGLGVSADGVETGAQADVLMALGCTRHQGHLHAPAMPGTALEQYLLDHLLLGPANPYDTRS
jgi:diguanylate cyclase (GGDEF)-like protein